MTRALIFALLAAGSGGGLLACGKRELPAGSGGGGTGGGGAAGGNPIGGGGSAGAAACAEGEPPNVIPWTLVTPDAGAGNPQTGTGAADAGGSDCQRTKAVNETDVACGGLAWLRVGTGTPTVVWDDGAQLVWNAGGNSPIPPPSVPAGGQRVWASFTDNFHVICPFCGALETIMIEVRESQGGKLLFLAQSGHNLPGPTGDQLIALFGVDADTRPTCSYVGMDNCTPVLSTQNDHVLRTTPAQVIPWGTPSTVGAPNGRFEVVWFSGAEKQTGPARACTDDPGATGPLTGFVASRVASPAP